MKYSILFAGCFIAMPLWAMVFVESVKIGAPTSFPIGMVIFSIIGTVGFGMAAIMEKRTA